MLQDGLPRTVTQKCWNCGVGFKFDRPVESGGSIEKALSPKAELVFGDQVDDETLGFVCRLPLALLPNFQL